jgi:hypothetical protein
MIEEGKKRPVIEEKPEEANKNTKPGMPRTRNIRR